MSFVTFNVKNPHANSVSDGQIDFTWSISQPPPLFTNVITATLEYRPNANDPNPRTIFQDQTADEQDDGTYILGPFTLAPPKLHIPAAPPFNGGHYNTLSGVVFTPSATNPSGSGTITGIFQDVGIANNDPDCSWDATATSPVPAGVKKAAY